MRIVQKWKEFLFGRVETRTLDKEAGFTLRGVMHQKQLRKPVMRRGWKIE